jgi:glycosyltransferase involved in cell wall biosynthesis
MSDYVLHFTGMHSLKLGSMEDYFLHVALACSHRGEITVLQYESMPTSKEYLEKLNDLGVVIEVRSIWSSKINPLINTIKIINKYRPRLVHAHFINRNSRIFIPLISHLFKVKTILYTVHNQPDYKKKHFSRFFYNNFTKLLPVSNAVKNSLVIAGVREDKVNTHYLGLFQEYKQNPEIDKFWRKKLDIPINSKIFICIAFDAEFKGIDVLLKAFAVVLKSYPDVYFLSVGVDTAKSSLPALAKKLSIDRFVRWAGVVNKGFKLLSVGDIYVQPSRSEEGLPLAMMEAMAMGLPIVCTDVSGNVEAVIDEKNGVVARRNDPDDLAAKMIKILCSESKWTDYTLEGQRRYRLLFDGNKSVKTLLDDYYQ